jgi:hypothetical protein
MKANTKMVLRRMHWALFGLLAALSIQPAAAVPVTESHPVPMQFDGVYAPSQVYVRYTADAIDEMYDVWRSRAATPAERTFVRLMDAFKSNNANTVRDLLDMGTVRGTAAQVTAHMRKAFNNYASIQVVRHVQLGAQHVFYYRVISPKMHGVYTAGFALTPRGGSWVAHIVNENQPIASLIAYTIDGETRNPSLYRAVPAAAKAYSIPMNEAGSVRLEFDLNRTTVDPFAAGATSSSAAVRTWMRSAQQMRAAQWSAVAAGFTDQSKTKIEDWRTTVDADTAAQAALAITNGLKLMAEIPLGQGSSLLLCEQGDSPDRTKHVFRYVWVTQTPTGLKMSNYFRRFRFEGFLRKADGWPKQPADLDVLLSRHRKGGH